MKNDTTSNEAMPYHDTDIQSLRLPPNYGATLGVKKLLIKVSVDKPKKEHFFRTHLSEEMTFCAMLLEQKEVGEKYLASAEIAQVIPELVRPVRLHAAIDRQNNVFLIPVPLPGESGARNPWHESLAQAVELAKSKWLRISANMHTGGYDVYVAEGPLPDPEWPEVDIETLIEVAFRDKIITTLDHPMVQMLLGRV